MGEELVVHYCEDFLSLLFVLVTEISFKGTPEAISLSFNTQAKQCKARNHKLQKQQNFSKWQWREFVRGMIYVYLHGDHSHHQLYVVVLYFVVLCSFLFVFSSLCWLAIQRSKICTGWIRLRDGWTRDPLTGSGLVFIHLYYVGL